MFSRVSTRQTAELPLRGPSDSRIHFETSLRVAADTSDTNLEALGGDRPPPRAAYSETAAPSPATAPRALEAHSSPQNHPKTRRNTLQTTEHTRSTFAVRVVWRLGCVGSQGGLLKRQPEQVAHSRAGWPVWVREYECPEKRGPQNAKRSVPGDVLGPLRVGCSFLAGESAEFGRCGSPKWKTSHVGSERRFHYLRLSEAVKSH